MSSSGSSLLRSRNGGDTLRERIRSATSTRECRGRADHRGPTIDHEAHFSFARAHGKQGNSRSAKLSASVRVDRMTFPRQNRRLPDESRSLCRMSG